jgi:hypothetical protein
MYFGFIEFQHDDPQTPPMSPDFSRRLQAGGLRLLTSWACVHIVDIRMTPSLVLKGR